MIKVIETNISINNDNIIQDHQSRVIEVYSWEEYIEEIKNCKSINRSSTLGSLHGTTLPKESKVENLSYDDNHLMCDVINRFGIRSKKLTYKV
jgi:hypothetical protein